MLSTVALVFGETTWNLLRTATSCRHRSSNVHLV